MLGEELCRTLAEDHEVIAWDIQEIDITDRARTLAKLEGLGPRLILNAAAFVDVEACEKQPETAWKVNAVGSQNLALAARRLDSEYLYISSDYIFDGETAADYDEISAPCPINQYGRTKLAGERLALQVWPRTYVARTAWLFGHRPKNYVDRVLTAAEKDGVVRMPEDQIESPTYTVHLARALRALIATSAWGIYDVTSLGACTRLEFARYVLSAAGKKADVEKVETSALSRTARRPGRTVLDCRLLRLVTGHALPDWKKGVDDYLAAGRGR